MDLGRGRRFHIAAHTNIHDRGFLLTKRDDARSGRCGHRDRGHDQQRLVDTAAANHMLNRLHRLARTDAYPIDGEFEPRL